VNGLKGGRGGRQGRDKKGNEEEAGGYDQKMKRAGIYNWKG